MRSYSITYFIAEALKGLWRNGVMSLASIAVLVSCLIVLGAFSALVANINYNLQEIGAVNQIVAFIDPDTSDEDILSLRDRIAAMDNVSGVRYISKEEAYQSEKEKYSEYPELFAKLEGDNPYTASLVITFADIDRLVNIEQALREEESVYKISKRTDVAATIESFKQTVILIATWFMILLLVVSVFVIINTIKLAVFARRQEISIMRYIGATSGFIMVPFIIEGILIGLISGGAAYGVVRAAYGYASRSISEQLSFLSVMPFDSLGWYLLGAFMGIGLLCGVIGSLISMRRYLDA